MNNRFQNHSNQIFLKKFHNLNISISQKIKDLRLSDFLKNIEEKFDNSNFQKNDSETSQISGKRKLEDLSENDLNKKIKKTSKFDISEEDFDYGNYLERFVGYIKFFKDSFEFADQEILNNLKKLINDLNQEGVGIIKEAILDYLKEIDNYTNSLKGINLFTKLIEDFKNQNLIEIDNIFSLEINFVRLNLSIIKNSLKLNLYSVQNFDEGLFKIYNLYKGSEYSINLSQIKNNIDLCVLNLNSLFLYYQDFNSDSLINKFKRQKNDPLQLIINKIHKNLKFNKILDESIDLLLKLKNIERDKNLGLLFNYILKIKTKVFLIEHSDSQRDEAFENFKLIAKEYIKYILFLKSESDILQNNQTEEDATFQDKIKNFLNDIQRKMIFYIEIYKNIINKENKIENLENEIDYLENDKENVENYDECLEENQDELNFEKNQLINLERQLTEQINSFNINDLKNRIFGNSKLKLKKILDNSKTQDDQAI